MLMGSYSTAGLLVESTEGAAPPDSMSLILHVGTAVTFSLSQLPSFTLAWWSFACITVGMSFSVTVYVCVWTANVA